MSPIPQQVLMPGGVWGRPSNQDHLARSIVELKCSWWPRNCFVSKKLLWFTQAYRARRIITGPGEPIVEDRWYSTEEFLILKLKGY